MALINYYDSINDMYESLNRAMEDDYSFTLKCIGIKNYYNYNLLVEVVGGRKYRGMGYLVDYFEESYNSWRSCKARIYDPVTNCIYEVSAEYVKLHDSYKEDFRSWMAKQIEEMYEEQPKKFQSRFSLVASKYFARYMNLRKNFIDIPEDVRYPDREAKQAKKTEWEKKQAEFKKLKMQQLLKWAEEVAGKKGDEAIALAERIWKKKYE